MDTMTIFRAFVRATDKYYFWKGNTREGAKEQKMRRSRQSMTFEDALIYRLQDGQKELTQAKERIRELEDAIRKWLNGYPCEHETELYDENLNCAYCRIVTYAEKVLSEKSNRLDKEEDAPTLASLRGIAPDILGDEKSEDFVRRIRNEWDKEDA
jgi:hypothetical protein